MPINFTRNEQPTIGIEVELHLVDAETGALVSAANELLDEMGAGHPGGEHPTAKHELFQSTVEIITGVCDTPAEAHRDLHGTLAQLRAVAERRGIVPISSGTHPFGLARDQLVSPAPRYHELIESMQWPARRLLICGMHVHVGVADGPRAIAIINELTRHLPLFLALSSSSPYFEGEDSGLASARSKVFESLPTAGLPPQIEDWVDFEAFMSTLLDSDCISSIREVWWDIRPHPDFGTVELRMCDATPTLREAVALAALAQALVVWCNRQLDADTMPIPPREWTVRENRWLAGRYGLDAELIVEDLPDGSPVRRPVRELVCELIDDLMPIATEIGSHAELADVVTILETGSGTQRQRRLVEAGGTLVDVVHHLVDELSADRPQP
jgi:carboxylate-amine ligase